MARFVHSQRGTARQGYSGQNAPPQIVSGAARDTPGGHARHERDDIVDHEVQLVSGGTIGRVNGHFGWRQGEDQPAVPRVDGRKADDVPKELSIRVGIAAVDDDVGADDLRHELQRNLTRSQNGLLRAVTLSRRIGNTSEKQDRARLPISDSEQERMVSSESRGHPKRR